MSQIFVLIRNSILNFRRARAAVSLTFIVPVVLIYIFGHVFGLYRREGGPSGIRVAVVNESGEPAATKLIEALQAEKSLTVITETSGADGTPRRLTEADVRTELDQNKYRFALILPADLLSDERIGVRVKFLSNPRNDIEAQMVNGLLQKTIFSNVPQLLGQSLQRSARHALGAERYEGFNRGMAATIASAFDLDPARVQEQLESGALIPGLSGGNGGSASGEPGSPAATAPDTGASADMLSRLIRIETEQVAGKDVKNPMAARIVGGYAIMFLLFAVSGSASAMFEQKASGIFQRLLAAPVRPAHIVWARFGFGVLLGIVQITALFIAGRIFFGLDILSNAPALAVITIAAAAACSSFGLLVTAISPSEAAASGVATLVVLSMSAMGGAWFPVSFMPEFMQTLSRLTLVYWAVEGMTDVLWAGRSIAQILPKVGVLALITVVVMSFSLWRFRRNGFFE